MSIGNRAAFPLFVATTVLLACGSSETATPREDFEIGLANSDSRINELVERLQEHLPDFVCQEQELSSGAVVDRAVRCDDRLSSHGFECYFYFERVEWAFCDAIVPVLADDWDEIKGFCVVRNNGDVSAAGADPYLSIDIACQGEITSSQCRVTNALDFSFQCGQLADIGE